MALTKHNDVSMHEAGHILIGYLMNDLIQLYYVTIDEGLSKTIDEHSDGGLKYKYLKNPQMLHYWELDQFCLFDLGGLAADIVNEHNGKVDESFFLTKEFIAKIQHYQYQGDMINFSNRFNQFHKMLKVLPEYYNYISMSLLTQIFSNSTVLKSLLEVRELIECYKTVEGRSLTDFLDDTYIREFRCNDWKNIKYIRKELFYY
ncbi:TPA: hypothetical protein NEG48_003651 [Elizabethkingia anophelis]|nr:hypothetical protein [Elizabethkingia anophelis]